jgi:uncharacterized protein (TIGR00251 family)
MKITVIAHPNAKNPRIEKDLFQTLHVYVSAPPLEGKANKAVTEALAEYFQIKRSKVILISGDKSKSKVFEIIAMRSTENDKDTQS